MTRIKKRGEEIREFILDIIESNNSKVIPETIRQFGITRQAVYQHLRNLVKQGALIHKDYGIYELRTQEEWSDRIRLADNAQEDVVWRNTIRPRLGNLPDNAIEIWHYGFTEMMNNVIDHSEGSEVFLRIKKTAYATELDIADNGVGIFNKIRKEMNLIDERHAVLELTKGKLTTKPKNHSGEGIFFTSRMFDVFYILSGEVFLSHRYNEDEDWILQTKENYNGTWITLKLKNNTSRNQKTIYDKFTDNYGFTKTVVPVRMAQYGNEKLVSRSQAKRLLERVTRFKTVLFDFNGVDSIGQAFADEVFRVFANENPNVKIMPIRANKSVMEMINRSKNVTDT